MSFRQQAALHHEAADFITDAERRFPDVKAFIEGLEQEAQDECAQVTGGIDPKSPHYLGDWLADHRNVTFHYPEMHTDKAAHGKEEILQALRDAATLEGTITARDSFGTVRFGFADDVAVQWLLDVETQVHLIEQLRESVLALARFAQRSAGAYLRSRPEGDRTPMIGPPPLRVGGCCSVQNIGDCVAGSVVRTRQALANTVGAWLPRAEWGRCAL